MTLRRLLQLPVVVVAVLLAVACGNDVDLLTGSGATSTTMTADTITPSMAVNIAEDDFPHRLNAAAGQLWLQTSFGIATYNQQLELLERWSYSDLFGATVHDPRIDGGIPSDHPGQLAETAAGVWVAPPGIGPLVVFARGSEPRRLGDGFGWAIASAGGDLWASRSDGGVVRVDQSTGATLERVSLAGVPCAISVQQQQLDVLSTSDILGGDLTLTTVDLNTGASRQQALGSMPRVIDCSIAVAGGRQWLTAVGTDNEFSSRLSAVWFVANGHPVQQNALATLCCVPQTDGDSVVVMSTGEDLSVTVISADTNMQVARAALPFKREELPRVDSFAIIGDELVAAVATIAPPDSTNAAEVVLIRAPIPT